MADFFSDQLIEEIKQASDIVEVLSEFLKLKRRGANYLCLCPFHSEKTPSFSISSSKQIYHCFGCGRGGNVYTFLMEHEKLSFPEALRFLAKRAGIRLPEKKLAPEEKTKLDQLFFANQIARNFYKKELWETEDGRKTLTYLKDIRRLTEETINLFELGFAPDAWDRFSLYAKERGITEDDLINAGLAVKREEGAGIYDRFRRRLIFPIMNFTGKTIAFGGRALSKDEQAKYINSPETELYNKSKVLYGLANSRPHIREKEYAIMVEGYMDFLTLWQAGFRNVVAASGTSFTHDHARLLARYAPLTIMLFDSDPAGVSAAKRCAQHLMAAELDFKVVLLPKGQDPDSFIKSEGADKLSECIAQAVGFPRFTYQTLDPPYERLSAGQKEHTLKELVMLSSATNSSIRRELFLQEVADVFQIDLRSLKTELTRTLKKAAREAPPSAQIAADSIQRQLQIQILAVLLSNPFLLDKARLQLSPEQFSDENILAIYKTMLMLRSEGRATDSSYLMDHIADPKLQQMISQAANDELGTEDTESLLNDLTKKLRQINLDFKRSSLVEKIKAAEKSGDKEAVERFSEELNRQIENSLPEEE